MRFIFRNLATQRFARLIAIAPIERKKNKGSSSWQWVCVCDCGAVLRVSSPYLVSGDTKSCGCLKTERVRATNRTHGKSGTPVYIVYKSIVWRCTNPKSSDYKDYGGRGIKNEFMSFAHFYETVGDPPEPSYTIDRYPNNNGNYAPGNVRWATPIQQANNKRDNHFIAFNGITQTLAMWAREKGMQDSTLDQRLKSGWSNERALTTPVRFMRRSLHAS